MPLSAKQRDLLEELPRLPGDGRYVKGARLHTANSLVRRGLARRIGKSPRSEAGTYVRIDDSANPGSPLPEGSRPDIGRTD